ncbi:unnamed protein product [Effrenium voratum]|nr:unnamed protein product [Effrenium voratum]
MCQSNGRMRRFLPLPLMAVLFSHDLGLVPGVLPRAGRKLTARNAESFGRDLQDQPFAVILPGFLGSACDFEDFAEDMRAAGYKAVVAPIEWWHWLPCIGGRSMRPILERIDHAVYQVLANDLEPVALEQPSYTPADFLTDMLNNPGGILKVGGSDDPAEYPEVQPSGADFTAKARARSPDKRRLAIVAHSAAGWICRLYLSSVPYGRTYAGADRVHSLVCLGSPHHVGDSLVFKALKYLEATAAEALPGNVRCLCVGAKGTISGKGSDMTRGAYELCGADPADDTVDGDGMTPLFSALAFEPADKMILDGVTHAPVYPALGPSAELAQDRQSKPWYGSPAILEKWLPWLLQIHE